MPALCRSESAEEINRKPVITPEGRDVLSDVLRIYDGNTEDQGQQLEKEGGESLARGKGCTEVKINGIHRKHSLRTRSEMEILRQEASCSGLSWNSMGTRGRRGRKA